MVNSGILYVVATPIGNLEDLTPRARRVLEEVRLIAAEDTRVSRKLLHHCGIHTRMLSLHGHSGPRRESEILAVLASGQSVAMISDAGTPGISDPGGSLVRAAVDAGVRVVPIPGASAPLAALSASGLDPSRFLFHGFLPRTRGDAARLLRTLSEVAATLIFFERADRLCTTLDWIRETLGDRPAVIGREVTKIHEEFRRGTVSELIESVQVDPPRGECTLLVEGFQQDPSAPEWSEAALDLALKDALGAGLSVRDAARQVAESTGLPHRGLYRRAIRLREPGDAAG